MFTKLSQKKLSNALLNSIYCLHMVLICQSETIPTEEMWLVCTMLWWVHPHLSLCEPHSSLQIFKAHPLSDCLNRRLPSMGCRFFAIWPQFIYYLHLHQSHSFSLKQSTSNFLLFIKYLSLIYVSVIQHMLFHPPEMLLCSSSPLSIWKTPINFRESDKMSLTFISVLS